MSSLPSLSLPTGKIGFAGMTRGWDEAPRKAFQVELPDWPTVYGEWRAKYAENGDDFDVEIVSVGYLNKGYLGSALPVHRKKFSARETEIVEELIRALFSDQRAKPSVTPFVIQGARFLGAVSFVPDWIAPKR